jgi:hypothetical protein
MTYDKERQLHLYEKQMHEHIMHAEFFSREVRRLRRELYGERHFDLVGDAK